MKDIAGTCSLRIHQSLNSLFAARPYHVCLLGMQVNHQYGQVVVLAIDKGRNLWSDICRNSMQDTVSSNKRIAKNTVFLYLRMIVVLFVSLYTTRVVLNVLGIVDYGIYNVVAGFVSMFSFLNTSMINTIQRYYSFERGRNNDDGLRQVFNTSIRIQAVLAVITFILLESIGIWYVNHKMVLADNRIVAANWVFQFSVFSLVLLILQIPYSASIIAHEKMDYFAVISIIDVFFKLGIAVFLPLVPFDRLIVYGLFVFIISVIDFSCYVVYSKQKFSEICFWKKTNKKYFKEMLGFSGWNVLESISYVFQGQGLNMLMNAFWGPVVNAARGIAYQIHGAVNGFSVNIATAFRPQLVESYAESDFKRTERLMFSMTKYGYLMLCIISLPICLEINQILCVWLNGTVPDHTISFTILVLVNMLINSFNMPLSQTVLATGNVRRYQIIRSFINASPLFISWLFIRLGYGPEIVFIVTIGVSIVNQVVSMVLLHQIFRFSYRSYLKELIVPCLSFTVLAPLLPLLVVILMPQGLLRLIIVCILSVLISCSLAYYLVMDKIDKLLIRDIWLRVIRNR